MPILIPCGKAFYTYYRLVLFPIWLYRASTIVLLVLSSTRRVTAVVLQAPNIVLTHSIVSF